MTTNSPVTWRDLVAGLTPQQIAELEYCERGQVPPGLYSPESSLRVACSYVRENRAVALCAHIPVPVDAIDEPTPWTLWEGDRICTRVFTAWAGHEDGILVQVLGMQYSDGRPTERSIFFEDADDNQDMTAERARTLARLLTEASDILGDGGEPPWPVDSATRPCCGVIGGHAPDCEVEPAFT